MSRKLIPLAATVVSMTAMGWGAACSNSSNNNDAGTSSSSSSGGSTSSSSGGSGSSSSSSGASSSSSSSSGASSSGSGSSSGSSGGDAGSKFACAATATGAAQALIDNQSAPTGTQIALAPTFSPAACGMVGTWYDYNSGSGTTMGTIAPVQGSFTFSAAPPGLPSDAGAPPSDAAVPEGGIAGPKAACVQGVTGSAQYNTSGVGLNFTTVPGTDGGVGGNPVQAPLNASSFMGIQFWTWGGSDAGTQSVYVSLADVNETQGYGAAGTATATGQLCDPMGTGATACGATRSTITIASGWTLQKIAFAQFATVTGYGNTNESNNQVDPTALTQLQWQIQEPNADAAAGVPFNFCVASVSFY